MKLGANIEPYCEYCRHAEDLGNGEMICIKRGIVRRGYRCNKFKYDMTKRLPESRGAAVLPRFTESDFTLE
ncbi:MAG: hypothetical protein LBC78_04060 [Oscillospiraceae bacterium]|jgi:hypothetical protein|nr:hypothetical protein [Oscillospiraceae bacterium]